MAEPTRSRYSVGRARKFADAAGLAPFLGLLLAQAYRCHGPRGHPTGAPRVPIQHGLLKTLRTARRPAPPRAPAFRLSSWKPPT
eukprot:336943-Pyramimonas_sp.AAC.1